MIPQFNHLKVQYEALVQEKRKWYDGSRFQFMTRMELFSGLSQFESPAHVLKTITDLQKQNEVLVAQSGSSQVELKATQIQIVAAKEEVFSSPTFFSLEDFSASRTNFRTRSSE